MTIPERVMRNARRIPDRPAFMVRTEDRWQPIPWSTYGRDVHTVAAALAYLGIAPGDRVAILGHNRPEWITFDVGAMAAAAAPAGIYATSSAEEVEYILAHSGARIVLVENRTQWEKVASVRDRLPALEWIVLMRGAHGVDDECTLTWESFLSWGADGAAVVDERAVQRTPDALATLIYTSGTTGPPKGVMLTHDNLAWTGTQAVDLFAITSDDSTLSYLPLSHIAEQVFSIHAAATAGYPVWFARSIERLRSDLAEVRPTVFFGVPRVWEGIVRGVRSEVRKLDGPKGALAKWAMDAARVYHDRSLSSRADLISGTTYEAARRLVTDQIKRRIGLDRTRLALSGAAPIDPEVLDELTAIDLVVREVYGQSEDTGPTTINVPGATRIGSVGRPWPGTDVMLADDGEVLVRGRNVFAGYLGDAAATTAVLRDGWMHSGDVGVFDDDGYLTITGRKKEIIVTSGGKNIAPKPIEELLKRSAPIGEAVVVGDGRDYLSALIVVDDAYDGELDARDAVEDAIMGVNERLARVERIKRFDILPRPLTMEDGELTPTLKVKRSVVAEHFADRIAALYPTGR